MCTARVSVCVASVSSMFVCTGIDAGESEASNVLLNVGRCRQHHCRFVRGKEKKKLNAPIREDALLNNFECSNWKQSLLYAVGLTIHSIRFLDSPAFGHIFWIYLYGFVLTCYMCCVEDWVSVEREWNISSFQFHFPFAQFNSNEKFICKLNLKLYEMLSHSSMNTLNGRNARIVLFQETPAPMLVAWTFEKILQTTHCA